MPGDVASHGHVFLPLPFMRCMFRRRRRGGYSIGQQTCAFQRDAYVDVSMQMSALGTRLASRYVQKRCRGLYSTALFRHCPFPSRGAFESRCLHTPLRTSHLPCREPCCRHNDTYPRQRDAERESESDAKTKRPAQNVSWRLSLGDRRVARSSHLRKVAVCRLVLATCSWRMSTQRVPTTRAFDDKRRGRIVARLGRLTGENGEVDLLEELGALGLCRLNLSP